MAKKAEKSEEPPPTTSTTDVIVKQLAKIPKNEDISNIFDKQRENIEQGQGTALGGTFGKGGSLGFGFRGTIPKLPSFKVINRHSSGMGISSKCLAKISFSSV